MTEPLREWDIEKDPNSYPAGPAAEGKNNYKMTGWEGGHRGLLLLTSEEAAVIGAAPAMLFALRLAEWGGAQVAEGGGLRSACPSCGGVRDKNVGFLDSAVGHRPRCALASSLALADGVRLTGRV